jgi:glutamate--cysteine ligase
VQSAKIYDVSLTPAARTLKELQGNGESFFEFALRMSQAHKSYFLDLYPPNEQQLSAFRHEAETSLEKQAEIERSDTLSFDEYLANYLAPIT